MTFFRQYKLGGRERANGSEMVSEIQEVRAEFVQIVWKLSSNVENRRENFEKFVVDENNFDFGCIFLFSSIFFL